MFAQKCGDIFESNPGTAIGHCISADGCMSKGIAKLFVKKYPELAKLRNQNPKVGEAVLVRVGERVIFNLVTKARFWQKPTLAKLEESLESMKWQSLKLGISIVNLPKIGCGLDRLRYEGGVKPVIERIFKDSGVNIVVYTLEAIDLSR